MELLPKKTTNKIEAAFIKKPLCKIELDFSLTNICQESFESINFFIYFSPT
jgi:hypothetical protein